MPYQRISIRFRLSIPISRSLDGVGLGLGGHGNHSAEHARSSSSLDAQPQGGALGIESWGEPAGAGLHGGREARREGAEQSPAPVVSTTLLAGRRPVAGSPPSP